MTLVPRLLNGFCCRVEVEKATLILWQRLLCCTTFIRRRSLNICTLSPPRLPTRERILPTVRTSESLWGLNLELDRRAYYNLTRLTEMSYDGDGLKALVACLEQYGWSYRTLWSVQKDETNSIIAPRP